MGFGNKAKNPFTIKHILKNNLVYLINSKGNIQDIFNWKQILVAKTATSSGVYAQVLRCTKPICAGETVQAQINGELILSQATCC